MTVYKWAAVIANERGGPSEKTIRGRLYQIARLGVGVAYDRTFFRESIGPRSCRYCDSAMTGKRPQANYCSRACEGRAWREKKRKGPPGTSRGEDHYAAKLTEGDVRLIRLSWADVGKGGREACVRLCAKTFGVSPATIRSVVHGRSWRHV